MELKGTKDAEKEAEGIRFNRTFMELKGQHSSAMLKPFLRFNRTFMELKEIKKGFETGEQKF